MDEVSKQSSTYIWRSAVAGGIAGCVAKTVIAPLDRVKILLQTANPDFSKFSNSRLVLHKALAQIVACDGVGGLFKGHSATILRIFPYAAIKFVAYEQVRHILIPDRARETSWRRFLAGSVSGILSVFCTYPLDLIRVRLAYQTRVHDHRWGSLWNTVVGISHETGARGTHNSASWLRHASNFYKGFVPTMLGMIPYAGVSFWAHDLVHDIFYARALAPIAVLPHQRRSKRSVLRSWAQLLAGGLAGLMAQTASYPMEVIRRRIQVSALRSPGAQTCGIVHIARTIYAESGLRGFYVGLTVGYIKVAPMMATSFFVYERLKHMLGLE